MHKAVLVFSGYNQRAVVTFLRTLDLRRIPYAIIASGENDTIFLTSYAKNVYATRKKRQLDLGDIVNCINRAKVATGFKEFLISPSTEALNRYLLTNSRSINSVNCFLPLVSKALYERISDKYTFSELCFEQGIDIPREYSDIDEAVFPFVAKPYKYIASDGETHSPILIYNDNDLTKFKNKFHLDDFYFQEFVKGESYYLQYYFYRDGQVAKTSQKNYIQQPNGKSILAAMATDFHTKQESSKYEKLFRSLSFVGLVMVEVKYNKRHSVMIEANPRFWGPSQLMFDAQENLFEDFLYDNDFLTTRPVHSRRAARYFWGGGVKEVVKQGDSLIFHNYSEEQFMDELTLWATADLYNREDTRSLYKKEIDE